MYSYNYCYPVLLLLGLPKDTITDSKPDEESAWGLIQLATRQDGPLNIVPIVLLLLSEKMYM